MYTRSYYSDGKDAVIPPENYDGVTFSCQNEGLSPQNEPEPETMVNANPWETEAAKTDKESVSETVAAGGILSKIPLLSGVFGKGSLPIFGSLSIPKIGNEELLIIGAALFLFLSKEGDKHCAIMLLLLLLIS